MAAIGLLQGCVHSTGMEYSRSEIDSMIDEGYFASNFIRADAVVLINQKRITVNPDGSKETVIHRVVE